MPIRNHNLRIRDLTGNTNDVRIVTTGVSASVVLIPAATAPQQAIIDAYDWTDAAYDAWETEQLTKTITKGCAVRLQADRTTNTNPGYADCTGLSFQLGANTHYAFQFDGAYTAVGATTGIQLAVNGPANSFLAIGFEVAESATAWRSACSPNFNQGVDGTASAGATLLPWHIFGNISTTAAGILIVRFRSETNGQNVTIRRGSYGILKAIE